jgi:HNH endonuclease
MKYNVKRHAVVQPQDQSIRFIPLTQGKHVIVDAADYEWLMQWNWHVLAGAGNRDYAARGEDNETILMHRVIVGGEHEAIDHVDGNPLNNRRSNLRGCTTAENQWNTKLFSTNTSGHRGVSWNKRKKKWSVSISIGMFSSISEAAAAYERACYLLRGKKYP